MPRVKKTENKVETKVETAPVEVPKEVAPAVPPTESETKCETKCETKTCEANKTIRKFMPKGKDKTQGEERKKREPSAYIRFCTQEREKVKTELPALKFTEIGQELGKRWKALTPEQQASYKQAPPS